jgi:hypothetical protein
MRERLMETRGSRGILLVASVAVVAAFDARVASACGSSGPDGVSACSLEQHDEDERPRWRVAASDLYTSTAIHFSDDIHAGETRGGTFVSLSYAPTRAWSFEAGGGALLGGKLTLPDGTHSFSVGPAASVGASWRVVEGRPFLILTSLLSFNASRTTHGGEHAAYDAFDLRLGAAFGTTLWNVLSPYALGRVFGGPVYWAYGGESVTGTDTHHFQLGGGIALLIARRVDLFVEGVPLGEQAVAGGISASF